MDINNKYFFFLHIKPNKFKLIVSCNPKDLSLLFNFPKSHFLILSHCFYAMSSLYQNHTIHKIQNKTVFSKMKLDEQKLRNALE